jgi:hypothetical protein
MRHIIVSSDICLRASSLTFYLAGHLVGILNITQPVAMLSTLINDMDQIRCERSTQNAAEISWVTWVSSQIKPNIAFEFVPLSMTFNVKNASVIPVCCMAELHHLHTSLLVPNVRLKLMLYISTPVNQRTFITVSCTDLTFRCRPPCPVQTIITSHAALLVPP